MVLFAVLFIINSTFSVISPSLLKQLGVHISDLLLFRFSSLIVPEKYRVISSLQTIIQSEQFSFFCRSLLKVHGRDIILLGSTFSLENHTSAVMLNWSFLKFPTPFGA